MSTINNANGVAAGVTSDGRLMVTSQQMPYAQAVAVEDGQAYRLVDAAVTPTGAADVFCKMQNNSSDNMMISEVRIYDAGAELIQAQVCPAYTSGGTHAAIVPVNKNVGSVNLAATKGLFESDVDITGDAGVLLDVIVVAATTDKRVTYDPPICIGPNQAFLLEAQTGTSAINYHVDFYFATVPAVNS